MHVNTNSDVFSECQMEQKMDLCIRPYSLNTVAAYYVDSINLKTLA